MKLKRFFIKKIKDVGGGVTAVAQKESSPGTSCWILLKQGLIAVGKLSARNPEYFKK